MKDRFKFRVWNGKEMLYNGGLGYGEGNQLIEDKGHIIMQSTGLKDRNGKLIYEGDILKVVGKQTDEIIGIVQWLDDFGKVVLNINDRKKGEYKNCDTLCEFEYLPVNERNIIGNIYTNKELLGEQK